METINQETSNKETIETNNKELYQLYLQCVPSLMIGEEAFYRELNIEHCEKIILVEKGTLIGFSLLQENAILLMCVAKEFRKRGYGKQLLIESEQLITTKGYPNVVLGCGSNYLVQGVPMEQGDHLFFAKCGYQATWESVNMALRLQEFDLSKLKLWPCPERIVFRYAREDDTEQLLNAVEQVEPSWVRYFKDSEEPVLLAVQNETILGFEFVSAEDDIFYLKKGEITGVVGCVGVIPSSEGRGIGRWMVAYGFEELRKAGSDIVYIRYTGLEQWYATLGCETVSRQWMGEKQLEKQKNC